MNLNIPIGTEAGTVYFLKILLKCQRKWLQIQIHHQHKSIQEKHESLAKDIRGPFPRDFPLPGSKSETFTRIRLQ